MELLQAEKSHLAKVHNENHETKLRNFRRFWVMEPRHSESKTAKKRYTSIVARVRSSSVVICRGGGMVHETAAVVLSFFPTCREHLIR